MYNILICIILYILTLPIMYNILICNINNTMNNIVIYYS
jgi:hypothetical protein